LFFIFVFISIYLDGGFRDLRRDRRRVLQRPCKSAALTYREMQAATVVMTDEHWIKNVISDLKLKRLEPFSFADLEVGEKPDSIDEVVKLVGSSTYREVYVEFDGNVKERDEQEKEVDKERRKAYLELYCPEPGFEGIVGKATNQEDCEKAMNDNSSINIAVWATLNVNDADMKKMLIGAVTFRSCSQIRLIPILEIAVKVSPELSCLPGHLLSFLLSLMRVVHAHLRVLPDMKKDKDQLSGMELKKLLDVYPYTFISKDHEQELFCILKEMHFAEWKRNDCFLDDTLNAEASRNVKEGGKVMMLKRGEFVCWLASQMALSGLKCVFVEKIILPATGTQSLSSLSPSLVICSKMNRKRLRSTILSRSPKWLTRRYLKWR